MCLEVTSYYDPEIGRFINADGLISTGQGLLGTNMFAYCGNNPVNRVDPTGMFWKEIGSFFKGIAEVVVDVVVTVADAINDTIIGPIMDLGKKVSGVFKMKDVGENVQKNKRIHTENVVNAGVDSNFEPKPFVGDKEKQVEGYKERCIEQYQVLRIHTDYIMNVDIEGKGWNDLSTDIQNRLVNDMLVWDRNAHYAFGRKALSDLVEIGWDIVY